MATKIQLQVPVYMVFVCIQFDCEFWFHLSVCLLFAFWYSWLNAVRRDAVVLARLCIVFFVMRPMMHENFAALFSFRWQSGNRPPTYRNQPIRNGIARVQFFVYLFFCDIRWNVMTKPVGYLKEHMSFWSMPERDRCVWWIHRHTHHATTPIAEHNMCHSAIESGGPTEHNSMFDLLLCIIV